MIKYNLIIIEFKVQTHYLNLNKEEFFKHLWEWTFEYDLWDNIESENLLSNEEELIDWIWDFVIPQCLFHKYEEDEINCVAFINSDEKCEVSSYNGDEDLVNFILSRIHKHYGND